jgi:DNA-directed RNA polymerase specialized sigma24 family protein
MVFDEKKLVRQAQAGDALALVQIHDYYYWRFYRFFYYRVSDVRQAEKLTSALFLRMIEKMGLHKPGQIPFCDWLDYLAGQILAEWDHPAENGVLSSDPQEEDSALKPSLVNLPDDQREVIVGRFIEDRPDRRIADALRRSTHALILLQRQGLESLQSARSKGDTVDSKKDRGFDMILDEALVAVQAGANPEKIAGRYPAYHERLMPLLTLARQLMVLPDPHPNPTAQMNSKTRMLQVLADQKKAHRIDQKNILEDLGGIFLKQRGKRLLLIVFVSVIVFIIFSSAGVASTQALPGMWLYPVKLTLQEVHVFLTFDPQSRQALVEQYQTQRQVDLERAIEGGLISAEDAERDLIE